MRRVRGLRDAKRTNVRKSSYQKLAQIARIRNGGFGYHVFEPLLSVLSSQNECKILQKSNVAFCVARVPKSYLIDGELEINLKKVA